MRCTVISFSVSVPVLSVQITVVSPSVSTDDRRRTSALRFAIRCVASASESVTVGSSPSGTSATVTPIANTNRSVRPIPASAGDDEEQPADRDREQRHDPRQVVELALERAALAPRLLCELGDPAEPGRHRRSRSPAPRPCRRSRTCRRRRARRARPAPTRPSASTRRREDRWRRAGRRPRRRGRRARAAARRPGTTSSLAISTASPSRRTRTRSGSILRSAATACSARCSWKNEKTALTTMTTDDRHAELAACPRPVRAPRRPTAGARGARRSSRGTGGRGTDPWPPRSRSGRAARAGARLLCRETGRRLMRELRRSRGHGVGSSAACSGRPERCDDAHDLPAHARVLVMVQHLHGVRLLGGTSMPSLRSRVSVSTLRP